MTVKLVVDGQPRNVWIDVFEFQYVVKALATRSQLHLLVHGLPLEKDDFLVQVVSYKDLEKFILIGKRVFVSTRGVRYVSAFY